jgi:anti-anti-sigma factor
MDTPSIASSPANDRDLPWWRQLYWQLLLTFLLFAIVPMLAMVTVVVPSMRTQTRQAVFGQLQSAADLKQGQIETWLHQSEAALNLWLSAPIQEQLRAYLAAPTAEDQPQITRILRDATEKTQDEQSVSPFRTLLVASVEGRVVAASEPAQIGRVVSRQPFFADALAKDGVHPPYYGVGNAELLLVMTRRLQDSQGQTVGIVVGYLDLSTLGTLLLDRTGLGTSGETYLVSRESNYMLTPSRFEGYPLTQAYRSTGIDSGLRGEQGAAQYTNYQTPVVEVFGVYRWVPELQAALVAEISMQEAMAAADQASLISLTLLIGMVVIAAITAFIGASRIAQPIMALGRVAARITDGDLDQRATHKTRNEIGALAASFNTMTDRLQQTLIGLEQRVTERTSALQEALTEREQTLSELQESLEVREKLSLTIRALATPVLPVFGDMLVVPLIGVIDSARAAILIETVLQAIEQQHARTVIIDVTGVPLIDTQVASVLVQMAQASRLVGARPLLVGVRPELAHTMVSLGIDLSMLQPHANLQSAISTVLRATNAV